MSRILAYTTPSRGHLYPLTPILDELRRRGHSIALRTLDSEVELMRARGFDAAAISSQVAAIPLQDYRGGNPRAALKIAVETFVARATFDAPDLTQAIAAEKPDAVIVDINSWGGLAAAEAWGGPWATFSPYPLALSSPDVPPFGPGLSPLHGPLGRVRDALLRPLVMGTIAATIVPGVNRVRAGLGLERWTSADEMFTRPPLLLYMTAEPFEYPRRHWPESIVMVGPCEWDPPAAAPAWLDGLDQPVVLVTTSSEFQDDGRLVEAALAGLAEEPVFVVATVPAGDPAAFRVPANARVERYVPHAAVLGKAACAVTHGGMGATQKALARGVPVCAVPFGRDQLEVARRVEVAGAGTRLPASKLTPASLRAKVREAMTKTAGAQRIADAFAKAGGPVRAADAFETRLLAAAGRRTVA